MSSHPNANAKWNNWCLKLKRFVPQKIAVYADESSDAEINANYQGYLDGTYELTRTLHDQIGFRLAKQMEHSKVYCVADWPKQRPILEKIDDHLMDYDAFAEGNNQEHLLPSISSSGRKIRQSTDGTVWIEREGYEPLIDMYIRINQPEDIRRRPSKLSADRTHWTQRFNTQVPIGFLIGWYAHNLKNFVNITRITESTDDRILLIIGAGHVHLIQQFLEDSGDYIVESPLQYLNADQLEEISLTPETN